jgi:DMSO/TMAO reductase YedYZ molybdopterin-dependent catalytic subunit
MNLRLTSKSVVLVIALVVIIVVSISAYITYGQTKVNSVEQAKTIIDYGELVTMPRTTVNADLYCVGSLVDHGNWTGVRLRLVLQKAGSNQQVESVEFYASDGYSTKISYSVATRDDVIIAYEKDGVALPEVTRLVIPDVNGDEWVSSISQIKIVFPSGNYTSLYLK